MRECSFRIFAATPGIIEKQHESMVQEVFDKGFKDSAVDVGSKKDMTEDLLTFSRSAWLLSKPLPLFSTQSRRRIKQNITPSFLSSSTSYLHSKNLATQTTSQKHLYLLSN
jgi:hypothetical protein